MQHFTIKPGVPLAQQAELGHNRWHPDIPFLSRVKPGEEIIIESLDFLDAQILDNDDVADVRDVDLTRAHPLTGPFYIEGAEPGDLLVVDLLDIKPITPVGFSGIFAKSNGGGFLADYFPDAAKAIWDLKGLYATSRHIPGVRIAGLTHPGLMGCLPSMDLLNEWNRREAPLAKLGLAKPPDPSTAVLRGVTGKAFEKMAAEAARTVPPREHGGNTDNKDLSSGTRIFFSGVCQRCWLFDGRFALLIGRWRDWILWCDRDGRRDSCWLRSDQGRHGKIWPDRTNLFAERSKAALQQIHYLRRDQRRKRQELLSGCYRSLSAGVP